MLRGLSIKRKVHPVAGWTRRGPASLAVLRQQLLLSGLIWAHRWPEDLISLKRKSLISISWLLLTQLTYWLFQASHWRPSSFFSSWSSSSWLYIHGKLVPAVLKPLPHYLCLFFRQASASEFVNVALSVSWNNSHLSSLKVFVLERHRNVNCIHDVYDIHV